MRKAMPLALIGAGILTLSMLGTSFAQSDTVTGRLFPVKFVCGVQRPNAGLTSPAEPPVKPGNYATVINIESLTGSPANAVPVTVNWSVSIPGLTSPATGAALSLGQFETTGDITCAQIARALSTVATNGFITGYVNIVGSVPSSSDTEPALAVTAVYTSQGCTFPFIGSLVPALGCSGAVSIDVVPEGVLGNFINSASS
jgi:hypothetical protein